MAAPSSVGPLFSSENLINWQSHSGPYCVSHITSLHSLNNLVWANAGAIPKTSLPISLYTHETYDFEPSRRQALALTCLRAWASVMSPGLCSGLSVKATPGGIFRFVNGLETMLHACGRFRELVIGGRQVRLSSTALCRNTVGGNGCQK